MRLTGAQIWIHGNGRYFSSGKDKKPTAKILRCNYELKQLYGAVVRKENTEDTLVDEPFNESKWKHAQKELHSPKASEMYWLVDHANQKRISVLKTRSKTTPTSPSSPSTVENSVETAPHKVKHTGGSVISTKQLLLQFISSKSNHTRAIPFDVPGLNSIPQYPLVCQKASTEQIDEALKNQLPSISKILTATMSEGSRYILKNGNWPKSLNWEKKVSVNTNKRHSEPAKCFIRRSKIISRIGNCLTKIHLSTHCGKALAAYSSNWIQSQL